MSGPLEADFDRLVGRQLELAALQSEFHRARAGEARPVHLVGDPGLGKTQLVRHFARWVESEGGLPLYTRFSEYAGSQLAPFEEFLDLLRVGLGARGTQLGTVSDVRLLARMRCGVNLPAELVTPATAAMAATGGGNSGDRFRTVVPLGDCFIRLTRFRPIALVLDDLQWADEADRDLIAYLLRTLAREPLLLVLASRDEVFHEDGDAFVSWLHRQATRRPFSLLNLRPWTEGECGEAIASIFSAGREELVIPRDDLKKLHRVSGGNPHVLAEMLRHLAAEGVFHREAGSGWRVAGLGDLSLPDSLLVATHAQVERVEAPVRELLEQAAVIGDQFRIETLSGVASRDRDEVEALLRRAAEAGLLAADALMAGKDYRFQHDIIRRVLYDGLTADRRRALHGAAAAALEAVYSDDPDRLAGAIGGHAEAFGDPAAALEWSLRAWRAARRRWHWGEAASSIEQAHRAALELGASAGPGGWSEPIEIPLGLGEGYGATGRLRESEMWLREAIRRAEASGDEPALANAQTLWAATASSLGNYQEAIAAATRAAELHARLGNDEGATQARLALANAEIAVGRYGSAMPMLESLLAELDPDSASAALASGVLGWALTLQGKYDAGQPLLEWALDYWQRTGDPRRAAVLLRRLAFLHLSAGDYEKSFEMAQSARDAFRRVDDSGGEAKAHMDMGQARLAQGLHEEAIHYLERTRESLGHIGDTHCEAEALWLLGRAGVETGRLAEAGRHLERAVELIREVGDRDDEFRILVEVARLRRAQGDDSAGAVAEQAAALARDLGNVDGEGLALVELGAAVLVGGDVTSALEAVGAAIERLETVRSGERWRAYRLLGDVLQYTGSTDGGPHLAGAKAALEKSVAFAAAVREQVPRTEARYAEVRRAFSSPARDLCDLLVRVGEDDAAESVREEWGLEG